jgi:c-di-GMP-binding flagellar brake protein YcgR
MNERILMTDYDAYLKIEKRIHERTSFYQTAHVYYGDDVFEGTILDISEGGLFIQTGRKVEMGREIKIAYSESERDQRLIERRAEIVRIVSKGFGVEFLE